MLSSELSNSLRDGRMQGTLLLHAKALFPSTARNGKSFFQQSAFLCVFYLKLSKNVKLMHFGSEVIPILPSRDGCPEAL